MRNRQALWFALAILVLTVLLVTVASVWPQSAGQWALMAPWVQTVGVLAALGGALRLQALSATRGSRQARRVASVFAANMHWVFRKLGEASTQQSASSFRVGRRILEEILSQGRQVDLQQLDGRSLGMMSSLRALGVEALELAEASALPDGSLNWRLLQAYFDKRLPNIAAWLTVAGNRLEHSGPTDYAGLRTSFGQLK